MDAKNFLKMAAMMMAMAMTSVMMISCTGNEDNTVIWNDIDPVDNPGGRYDLGYKLKADKIFFDLAGSSNWGGKWYNFENELPEDNFDASAYDYVWIKFSGNTKRFRFGVTYNEWKSTESWGETFYDNVISIEATEGIAYIELEKKKTYEFGGPDKTASSYAGDTWDKHIRNVFTQDDGPEVSVTVEGVWFGTRDELETILYSGESGKESGGESTGESTEWKVG